MVKEHVSQILKKITTKCSETSYLINCAYSDGQGKTLLLITFYKDKPSSIIGKITYYHETGEVCQYFYKKKRYTYTKDIINLLLDIYNDELLSSEKANL